MSKTRSAFFCQNCGYESTKWVGKCPSCEQWNTFVEEVIQKGTDKLPKDDWKEYGGLSNNYLTAPIPVINTSRFFSLQKTALIFSEASKICSIVFCPVPDSL